jgi:hypothetical protein
LTKIANDFFVMISKTKMLRSVQSFHQLKDGVSVAEANITKQEDRGESYAPRYVFEPVASALIR